MSKPRLLDLFCGAGGASMGYRQAGFEVVGVDIRLQPRYPYLVVPTHEALRATGRIYVIENVEGAPLEQPVMLCGEMFGLRVFRHRFFEVSEFLLPPLHPRHPRGSTTMAYRSRSSFANGATHIGVYGDAYNLADGKAAMGIHWMTRRELSQAIPPAYTRWIGEQLLAHYLTEFHHANRPQKLPV